MPSTRPFTLVLAAILALVAAPAAGQNLVVNGDFDSSLAAWVYFGDDTEWAPLDAEGEPGSGSVRVGNRIEHAAGGEAINQCIPVTAGKTYEIGASGYLPAGQATTGRVQVSGYWSTRTSCNPPGELGPIVPSEVTGSWVPLTATAVAPPGAIALRLNLVVLKEEAGGTLDAHFDDAFVCEVGTCDAVAAPWITSPEYPDFRFRVTITAGDKVFPGAPEASCQPDTVCVSGALRGRSEVFLRILGPRPNGYLWPTIVRFTPSAVEVEVEQLSRGVRRVYSLPEVPAGVDELSGLQDRLGFVP